MEEEKKQPSTRAELLAAAQVFATLSLAEATTRIGRPGHEETRQNEYRRKALRLLQEAEIEAAQF